MLGLILALAASATDTPSGAVITLGSSPAAECYQAARDRAATLDTIERCDLALSSGLRDRDQMATFVNRGVLRLVLKRFGEAESDFNAALAIDPKQPEAWLNKGVAAYSSGDSAASIRHFTQALALGTRRPELAYHGRGLANEDRGDLRSAYADFQQARTLAPKWKEPAVELARYQVRRR